MASRRLLCCIGFSLALSAGIAFGKERAQEPACEQINLPKIVQTSLKRIPDLSLSSRVEPSVITGDFDGDGRPDYAVLVTQSRSLKRGFLIVFANGRTVVAGAGRSVMYGAAKYPDLNFDQWERYAKEKPVESSEDQKPLKLRSDALLVSYHETASGLFYWDGKGIRWYQQGD